MSFFDKIAERFSQLNKKMKSRQRVVSVLSVIVVFATVYALILPAITLDKNTAQQQPGIKAAASEASVEKSGEASDEADPEEEPASEETAEPEEIIEEEQGPGQTEEEPEEIIGEESERNETDREESDRIEEEPEEFIEVPEQEDSAESDDESGAANEEPAPGVTETLADDILDSEPLSPEELEAAVAAGEIELITEKTQLTYEYIDEEYEKSRKESKDGNTDDVDDGYFVYAEFDASAKLPVGVELQAREITEESDPELYAMYREKTLAEMQDKYDDNTGIRFAKFYDIGFIYNGKRIEPSGDVKVRIEYKKEIEVEKDVKVDALHFDKENDEKPEVIESEVNPDDKERDRKNEENEPMKAVEFTSDRF